MTIARCYSTFAADDSSYDAIVIGSGVGGMSVAALLAKAGQRVLLLERHRAIGGYSHAFHRDGYEWDVGLHYVGGVHCEGSLPQRAFRYLTDGKLEWAELGPVYDRIVFGDEVFDFVRGREQLKAQLQRYFPAAEDVRAIDAYFALLDEVAALPPTYFAAKALPRWLGALVGGAVQFGIHKYAARTTRAVLEQLTGNRRLIAVLTAQYGDYGLPPGQSSFYMHALLANHYMEGAAYPVGGAGQLAATIVPVIEAHGGTVLCSAVVASILVDGNSACGVSMADGRQFRAKHVISDAGVFNTFRRLIPPGVAQRHRLNELLQRVQPASAHVALYVGLRQSSAALDLPKHNYWLFPARFDHDAEHDAYCSPEAPPPVAFVSFPSAKDPSWEARHPGRAVIEVITLVPHAWFARWADQPLGQRGDDYSAFKERIAQQLLAQLYRAVPQTRGLVDFHELSTPLSTCSILGHEQGAIYGLAHTPERFAQPWLRVHTPVRRLYLTGQDVCVASITGALMGGVLAASAVLGRNMLTQIADATASP